MGHLPVSLHISLQLVLANGLAIVQGTEILNSIPYGPPPNFVVSSSITIKFGVLVLQNSQKRFENDVTKQL